MNTAGVQFDRLVSENIVVLDQVDVGVAIHARRREVHSMHE